MANVFPIIFQAMYKKGRLITTKSRFKLIPNPKLTKMAIPVTPPSKNLLGSMKASNAIAARATPQIEYTKEWGEKIVFQSIDLADDSFILVA